MIEVDKEKLILEGSGLSLLSELSLIVHGIHDSFIEEGIITDEESRKEIMKAVQKGFISLKLLERVEK